MLKICSSLFSYINTFSQANLYGYATKPRKIQNLHQRMKRYGKYPQIYKLKTIIRPPNLRDDTLQYPLRIPIRYRHLYKPTKALFLDNTKDIKWQRLSPNEILLAFQNIKYLNHKQLIIGMEYLSKVNGQENHDWNNHPWVNQSFQYITKNFPKIQTKNLMQHYYLMKRLNCKNEEYWKKMYNKIEEDIYELYASDFQYLFLTYYKISDQYFSPEMKQKFLKLMQGRLRQFKNSSVLKIAQLFHEQNRLDNYWLENVFIPLFKTPTRKYRIEQIAQVFRFMMIVGHEKNERLYDNLYQRIMTYQYQSVEQIQILEDVILQVKQLFTSHRVEPYLEFLQKQKQRLLQVKEQKKLELHEIVKEDLIFFMEKRKIQQQRSAATS